MYWSSLLHRYAPQELVAANEQLAAADRDRGQNFIRQFVPGQYLQLRLGLEDEGLAVVVGYVQSSRRVNHRAPCTGGEPLLFPNILAGFQLIAGRKAGFIHDVSVVAENHR